MPSCTAHPSLLLSLAQLCQFGEIFPFPVPPHQPQLSQSGLLGLLRWVSMGSLVVLLFYGTPAPTGNPIIAFTGLLVLPEERKAAGRERRGQSQPALVQPQDSTAPKLPKGHEFHDGRAGILALGHSAFPLPISPAQTCPAPVSSHMNTHMSGKIFKNNAYRY